MKVFYRKELNGEVRELSFYDRIIDETVDLTVFKAYATNNEKGKTLYHITFPSVEAYTNMLQIMTTRLNAYGWHDDFDKVNANIYNTYINGKYLPCKITKRIDALENLKYPVLVHTKPKGSVELYYDGKFRDFIGTPTMQLQVEAIEILNALYVPFHAYLQGNTIIVYDMMMIDTPYTIRHRLLTELEGISNTITPVRIKSVEALEEYCKTKEEVVIMEEASLYLPSFSAPHAYVYSIEEYKDAIVVQKTTEGVICIDSSFETMVVLKTVDGVNLQLNDIVKYKDAQLKEEV